MDSTVKKHRAEIEKASDNLVYNLSPEPSEKKK